MDIPPKQEHVDSSDDYIFVCYSHADELAITAHVKWLQEQGYKVWYDANISGGAEWNHELALHIQDCHWFLYFISPGSVESPHCRAELNYAQQHGRRILAVEITPTDVPAGLQLMLNHRQVLFSHKLSDSEFKQRLIVALETKTESKQERISGWEAATPAPSRRRRLKIAAVLSMLLIVALLTVFMLFNQKGDLEFGERDWVVVGKLQNQTQDPLIGEALENSLRIALEQSKYASILPAAMVRAAQSRMHLDPDAPLGRDASIELAQRENAKVSILGNITQLGDGYSITIEMFRASDGATAWAGSTRADNLNQLLPAIDEISRQVREQLGESLNSIEVSSLPLAKVTTSDLEALRAYSLAEKSVATGDWETGLGLLQRALAIDPGFAMAHGKIASIYIAWALLPEQAAEHYDLALQNKSRLSPREQLYIEASSAWLKTPMEMHQAWKAMTVMYPNEAVGFNNLGEVLRRYYLDFQGAEFEYRASSERRAPWRYMAFYNLGQALLAQDRNEEALQEFKKAFEMEGNPVKFMMADAYIVLGRYDEALEFLSLSEKTESPGLIRAAQTRYLGLYADQGRFEDALELSSRMLMNTDSPDQVSRVHAARVALLERGDDVPAFRNELSKALEFELVELQKAPQSTASPVLAHLAFLARIAARNSDTDSAAKAIAMVRNGVPGNGFPVDQAWFELLEAEILLQLGDAAQALERTRRSMDHAELFQAYETLSRIYFELGEVEKYVAALNWMRGHRGRAFAEVIDWSYGSYGQLFNVLDWSIADRKLTEYQALNPDDAPESVAPPEGP